MANIFFRQTYFYCAIRTAPKRAKKVEAQSEIEKLRFQQPDIVVIPPPMNYILVWGPPQQPRILSGYLKLRKSKVPFPLEISDLPDPNREEPSPLFRVKNLGSVAHTVRMHWEQSMDLQQLLDEINKSEMFKKYPQPDDINNISYEDSIFQLPYLAPVIDNTSYEDVPIPYAKIYFAAVISGDPLKEWVKVPFRLTWDQPPGGEPTTFVVTATARNLHPSLSSPASLRPLLYSITGAEQIEAPRLPKIMAEITFGVEGIAP